MVVREGEIIGAGGINEQITEIVGGGTEKKEIGDAYFYITHCHGYSATFSITL